MAVALAIQSVCTCRFAGTVTVEKNGTGVSDTWRSPVSCAHEYSPSKPITRFCANWYLQPACAPPRSPDALTCWSSELTPNGVPFWEAKNGTIGGRMNPDGPKTSLVPQPPPTWPRP